MINDAVVIAKSKWYHGLADKIHDMNMNPKMAWESISIITGDESTRHKKENIMSMKMENGEYTSTDDENIQIFGPHFTQVLNNKRDVDFTVLDLIKQHDTMWELDVPITRKEFEKAVDKLKVRKAGGLNGVPPEAFKAMDKELRGIVFQFCLRY